MNLLWREGGRGWEGREGVGSWGREGGRERAGGREGGREEVGEGGREGRDDYLYYYTYYSDGTIYSVYRPTMKNYIYNDVTYYVITFKSAFD